jgi:hypothetical protein
MSTASATAATGEVYLDIIDEQPRTVVAFQFKGPLPGFRDVDKPELDQSVTRKQKIRNLRLVPFKSGSIVTFQPAVGERIIGAREVEIRDRGQSRKRGAFEPTFNGEMLELHAEPSSK